MKTNNSNEAKDEILNVTIDGFCSVIRKEQKENDACLFIK